MGKLEGNEYRRQTSIYNAKAKEFKDLLTNEELADKMAMMRDQAKQELGGAEVGGKPKELERGGEKVPSAGRKKDKQKDNKYKYLLLLV